MPEASKRVKTPSEHSDSEIPETEQPLTLFIMTPFHLCGFQLDPNPRQPPQSSDPSIKVSIDFFRGSYPIRMGIVKFDTKLWFFGGFSGSPFADLKSNGTSSNLRVFELDQSDGCLFPVDEFPNLSSPKRQPIVVRFRDKIFVHHVTDVGPRNLPPVLECLHVPSKTWVEVPQLMDEVHWTSKEGFVNFPQIVGWSYFVAFNKIFIISRKPKEKTYCFDMFAEAWDEDCASMFDYYINDAGVQFPTNGGCFSGSVPKDCALIIHPRIDNYKRPYNLYAFLVHKSGILMHHSELVMPLLDSWPQHYIHCSQVLDTGDGERMCVLLVHGPLDGPNELYVCFFKVKVNGTAAEAKIIEEHSYKLPSGVLTKNYLPNHWRAVFL